MVSWELVFRASVFIAEEMGVALRRSAFSPNIRERMDHSCAITDSEGNIVAQAEHIPVHLGSFRVGVKNLLNWLSNEGVELSPGDVVILNDPYISGTHLNDVMVMEPIYVGNRLIGYVVNKAHHVDVGGPVPGSINPPSAKTIYEEGLVIPPVKVAIRGELQRDILNMILSNFKTPETAIGDITAQLAANRVGVARVRELVEKYGVDNVVNAWREGIEYGRKLALMEIGKWPRGGIYDAVDYMELGDELLPIKVSIEIGEEGVKADFSGTHEQVEAPINAVYGVTFSAVSFAIRSLMQSDIPTNEGFYSVISVMAPEGTLVNPRKPAPVSGGNVETTQRIADVVFKALAKALPNRVPAAGSGTMMNVMIGGTLPNGGYWAYYETIGGGTGGRPGKPGVSGVHVNMTNTLNTPIEIAERQYPLLFTGYRIREGGSGGDGLYRGGDGIIRSFKVLTKARLSIMAERFRTRPWGGLWGGGGDGAPGRVTIRRGGNAVVINLPSKATIDLEPGDEVIIETPGGVGGDTAQEGDFY
ncbi:hydantoinase B/oxoprolinase family protein [Vulcanisaeta distributa]|uniref:hydantoinase B/oxoprolinase family protein n=1 Tax=Vulcanisaeta distributa TaxID=164451 RepID=UPI0006D00C8C|nr:hydantoinase B/oxoprolinase family protein [Vulcanisaeta distributa]